MMNVLIVYAHNEPTSLTASLKNVTLEVLTTSQHQMTVSDLYAQGFHAVAERYDFTTLTGMHFNYQNEQQAAAIQSMAFSPDIKDEILKIQNSDLIIFHFPVWWFSVPAILKGWLDRVLVAGFAWDGDRMYDKGLLRGKSVLVVATAGSNPEDYQPVGKHKATLKQMMYPLLHGTFAACGLNVIEPYFVYNANRITAEEVQPGLEQYRSYLTATLQTPRYFVHYAPQVPTPTNENPA